MTKPINDADVKEIEEALKKITHEGVWYSEREEWPGNENLKYWVITHEDVIAAAVRYEDAEFMAKAPAYIRQLLTKLAEKEAKLNQAVEALEKIKKYYGEEGYYGYSVANQAIKAIKGGESDE